MECKKLKVAALGGCGGMGNIALRTALSFDLFQELIIADIDYERASNFAGQLGPLARAEQLDINNATALSNLLSRVDVVLATVGPYYRFGIPVLKAAIESGCHYIDLNDDWESTLEMLNLNQSARAAGITAIIGMGASPGITNYLAVKAAGVLDTVSDLYTGWGDMNPEVNLAGTPGEGGSYGSAFDHLLQETMGIIRVIQAGTLTDIAPLEKIVIDFPGFGMARGYTMGHPEPITFHRQWPELVNSYNLMSLSVEYITTIKWIISEIKEGKMDMNGGVKILNQSPEEIAKILPNKVKMKMVLENMQLKGNKPANLPRVYAYARGQLNGRTTRVGASLSSGISAGLKDYNNMGALTGVPLAISLHLLALGKVEKKGVLSPEEAIEADLFFDHLAPLCSPARNSGRELVLIKHAYDDDQNS